MLFRRKPGIVNVKMIITEEKILSNIDKVEKLINPNSKKQIIQLDEDAYFKDLIDSIKIYLAEYPNKKNFPAIKHVLIWLNMQQISLKKIQNKLKF